MAYLSIENYRLQGSPFFCWTEDKQEKSLLVVSLDPLQRRPHQLTLRSDPVSRPKSLVLIWLAGAATARVVPSNDRHSQLHRASAGKCVLLILGDTCCPVMTCKSDGWRKVELRSAFAVVSRRDPHSFLADFWQLKLDSRATRLLNQLSKCSTVTSSKLSPWAPPSCVGRPPVVSKVTLTRPSK